MRTLFTLLIVAVLALIAAPAYAYGARGTLVVDNGRPDVVRVAVDGLTLGSVAPRTQSAYRLLPGVHDVELRGSAGDLIERSRVVLSPGAVATLVAAPPKGTIEIDNRSGDALKLSLDGASLGTLSSSDYRSVTVEAGRHTLVASYHQLGRDRVLTELRVDVGPSERASLLLRPIESGLVRVDNRTGLDATLRVDGVSQGTLADGASREVKTALGRVSFELVSSGRVLASTVTTVSPYADEAWRAEAPRTGDLSVANPLPVPVLVSVSGVATRTIDPYERATFSRIDVGAATVTAMRLDGAAIAYTTVEIRPYEARLWTIPAPKTGFVQLHNDEARSLRLYVDGRLETTLAPRQDLRLELAAGLHRVEAVDSAGRKVLSVTVDVDRYAVTELGLGGSSRGYASADRRDRDDDRHDHHDHDRASYSGHTRASY